MTDSSASTVLEITLESERFDCSELRIRKLSSTCAISRLFHCDLDVVCLDRSGIDVASVLGEPATIVFTPPGAEDPTRIHGIVAEVDDHLGDHAEFHVYRFRIMPRAHFLSLGQGQEIY